MDLNELAQRANALPARYQTRIAPDSYEDVNRSIRVGEWDEALANLVAALHKRRAAITTDERRELTELMTALDMPTDQLDALNVQA